MLQELFRGFHRGVFRTQANIEDVAFCEKKAVNYFRKKLHLRCSAGF